MNISPTSWHYRLLKRLNMLPGWWIDRTDLCTYGRRLSLALLLVGVIAFMGLTYPYGWYLSFHHETSPFSILVVCLWALSNALLLGGSGILAIIFLVRTKEKWDTRRCEKPYQASIFSDYWRSLKERTCVIVTYGDEKL